uniref:PHD finger protein 8 n=1 Tax=Oryzias sinensis TaxID=183150 RepID=A0A8C7XDX7_9TELE
MASVPVYCLCRLPYDVTRFMIECDICQDWFHGSCVGVEENKAAEIDLYHCPNCQVTHGPSVSKDPSRPVKTGSPQFVRELRSRTFPNADEILLKPSGAQLTVEFLEEHSFSVPVMVLRRDGLGMTLPPASFSVSDIQDHIGPDKEIDVIDVCRQCDLKMRLGDFVEYYNSPNRDRVLNVISLEFSETRLSNLVETPKIVRKLSWVENLWPEESVFERPNVQKYCLMGVKDSYTDFHIDFGGTSVWYHVLRGEKIFYLISPTPANLALFEQWNSSSNQNEMFFGDQVDMCYKCSVKQGNTLFIPTGWIHAVLTPVDCLAFGGNFLHSLNIDMQIRAYEIEKRLSTAELFKFPNFETVCWYAGKHLLDTLRGLRENRRHPASYLINGAKALNNSFRSWTRKEALGDHEVEIPETINTQTLVKDLAKEIRMVEVHTPPYPHTHTYFYYTKAGFTLLILMLISDFLTISEFFDDPLTSYFKSDPYLIFEFTLYNAETIKRRHSEDYVAAFPHSADLLQTFLTAVVMEAMRRLKEAWPWNGTISLTYLCLWLQEDYTTDEEALAAHGVQGGAGGILDLLKASKQVAGLDSATLSEEAPASPSTRDAIQGMLSMANPPSSSSSSSSSSPKKPVIQRPGKRTIKRPARHLSDEDSPDEQETLGTCFKDSDYVYPSLESDEEDYTSKTKMKRKKNWDDTPWSPKARVMPTLPKQDRPPREGARVASVETGLAAAAAKLAQQEQQKPAKRKYSKRQRPPPVAPPPPVQSEPAPMDYYSASLLDHEYTAGPGPFGSGGPRGSGAMAPGVFLTSRRHSLSPQNTSSHSGASPAGKRPKKGLATAKQRLGKILKIHRNGKLLL